MVQDAELFLETTGAALPEDYSLIRPLGEGSMSYVFLARNNALKRLVAVKVLRRELAADPVGRKRFVREAQSAARIEHESVTTVYSVGTLDGDVPFIEMQYIDGGNLADYLLAHGPLDVRDACRLLAQLASALAAAHKSQVIHRDVEPANVLIENQTGHAYLGDFGVAGILETGSETVTRLTREDDRLGNPTYMSPEQLRGEPLTQQADIYGLGLLGYEMLTANGPFGKSEVTDIVGAHLRRPPIVLQEALPDIPPSLSEALQRCLSKRPEHRPSAARLAQTFARIAAGGRVEDADEPSADGALASFLKELQKRRVYRAAATYAAAVFVLLQVADLVLPPLSAPDWIYRTAVIGSLAAFPAVLALAWVFDVRKGRLTRTGQSDSGGMRQMSLRQLRLLQLLGLLLSVAVCALLAWWLLKN